eukprot:m.422808 g.422808  ORF g.422808 m.422808 type:complete len:59 (+) comp38839_c0_seq1:4587-4763(+)
MSEVSAWLAAVRPYLEGIIVATVCSVEPSYLSIHASTIPTRFDDDSQFTEWLSNDTKT